MTWKETVNGALTRATGYQLQRAGGRRQRPRVGELRAGDRLVEAPVFVICTLRSGSTLLRVLLDSHSQIRSPHELHLRYVSVHFDEKWSERSMNELGLDTARRRVPAVGPAAAPRAGRQRQVDHRRQDAQQRLHRRPPARGVAGRALHLPAPPPGRDRALAPGSTRRGRRQATTTLIIRYCEALEAARQTYDGHTVRYEDLTADPERELRAICDFLGLDWEPGMLEYGKFDHGRYKVGLGDWADKIKTGEIQPPEPPPPLEEIHPALREMTAKWGYLEAEVPLDRGA